MPNEKVSDTPEPTCRIPETGFLRIRQICGDLKAAPPLPPIIPVGKSSWWAGVRNGRYPKPIKLSPRVTVWRVEDIRRLIAEGPNEADNET